MSQPKFTPANQSSRQERLEEIKRLKSMNVELSNRLHRASTRIKRLVGFLKKLDDEL